MSQEQIGDTSPEDVPSRNDVSVFVSYAHRDDDSSHGRVKKLAQGIANTYASLTGLDVGIFFDTESIRLGENWRDRIRAGLNSATVLLAFISPSYLRSPVCREELAGFFAFLPSAEGRKLVIPILLFPRERIERYFSDDDLWSDIQLLQWKDASELRNEEPGSPGWMSTLEQISERIEEALLEQSEVETSDTLMATAGDSDSTTGEGAAGLLEQISVAEEEMPQVGELVTSYGNLIHQFNSLIEATTEPISKAATFGQRLALSKQLAASLDPVVDESHQTSEKLRDAIQQVSPGIVSIIRMVGASGEANDQDNAEIQEFLKIVRDLSSGALEAADNVEIMIKSIEGGKGFSSDLDKVLNRMNSGLLMFFESRSHYKSWLEELDRLGFES